MKIDWYTDPNQRRKLLMKTLILMVMFVFLVQPMLWAESLKLKNGLTVQGRIANQDQEKVQLETDLGVTLT